MKNKIVALFSIFVLVLSVSAQDKFYYENAVYQENIKTVQAFREGFVLSNPIIGLRENLKLVFKFDDISPDVKDYYYTVVHCDADWNESYIVQDEYLDGFMENPVIDYALSFNTIFEYVNYQIVLPNEQLKFKLSGNYALVVYEDQDRDKRVLTQRFHVVENSVGVEGRVRRPVSDAFKGANHQVEFKIHHPDVPILNPRDEVKVVLMQNYRWDNAIRNLKPLYIRDKNLDYTHASGNIFKAGNEFRYFDNRTNRMNGENVVATDFHRPYFHKTVKLDEARANKKFFSYQEMNGRYTIESQDQEVRDPDTECDYTFVHFTLDLDAPLLGGSVNVFGGLSNWNANKSNEMTYNFETGNYELSMLLKQGYYNYMYVYVPNGALIADHSNIEGSFWETENDYQVFVYYRDLAGRYDRLVGYRMFNSKDSR